jgi:polyisoprenoid-binding protein YceI
MKQTLLLLLLAVRPAYAFPSTYRVDPALSRIDFSVRHFFSPVQGWFKNFRGYIRYDRSSPSSSAVNFQVQARSLSTDNEVRDRALRGPAFFDVDRFGKLEFHSRSVEANPTNRNRLEVTGELTVHGVSKTMTIPVDILGFGPAKGGRHIGGFSSVFQINRKDFGISWNKYADNGSTILGDEVNVKVTVEATGTN